MGGNKETKNETNNLKKDDEMKGRYMEKNIDIMYKEMNRSGKILKRLLEEQIQH